MPKVNAFGAILVREGKHGGWNSKLEQRVLVQLFINARGMETQRFVGDKELTYAFQQGSVKEN